MQWVCFNCGQEMEFVGSILTWSITEASPRGKAQSLGIIVFVCSPECKAELDRKNTAAVEAARKGV